MDEIIEIVSLALDRVYAEDNYLIENQASERSLVSRFGVYFRELLEGTDYERLNLDIEYNRNMSEKKSTQNFPNGTYPDLILHQRGSNEQNTLIVEFKPWWNTSKAEGEKDISKLRDFTNPDGEYKYKLGMFVFLGRESPSWTVVRSGNIVVEDQNE